MGSSESSLRKGAADRQPVWTPLTGSLADDLAALKSGSETDASRAKAIEVEIQKRIAAELHRIRAAADAAARDSVPALLEQASSTTPSSTAAAPADDDLPSRHVVSQTAEALRARLEDQKRRRERAVPAAVEAARQDVTRCLREQDRTPLNCWREVGRFRDEVAKLEREWVDKTA